MKKLFWPMAAMFLIFIFIPVTNVGASGADDVMEIKQEYLDPIGEYDLGSLQIREPDGSILTFETKENMSSYLENKGVTRFGTERLVGKQVKKMKFISYSSSTPAWKKASKYVIGKGSKLGFSGKVSSKWGNVGISFTKKYSVSSTIPANSKKYSRLAGYADLEIKRYLVSVPNVSTSYYVNRTKTLNKYVRVKYK